MASENGASTLDREEAIAYGTEGLIQAVDHFDASRGTTFASFAIRRIRGSILDAIRRMDVLPRSMRRSAREVEHAGIELAAMLGRWPTPREVAMRLNIPVEQVRRIAGHSGSRVVSLEKLMTDRVADGGTPWEAADASEFSDPAEATDHRAILELLDNALLSLAERDREIIRLRYARGLSFHEIGDMMALSESRVCQLHKRVLLGLRQRLDSEAAAAA
jgi:RNA polymerase sigma factor for flagellar operon FliA